MSQKTLLIIEDSKYIRTLIGFTLSKHGYKIVGQTDSGIEGQKLAIEHQPDLITIDNVLTDSIGTEVLKDLQKEQLSSKVIMVSALGQDFIQKESKERGADGYIVKPFTPKDLLKEVERIFEGD